MTPVGNGPDSSVEDTVSLGRNAETAEERREALLWCIANPWSQEDIASVARLDTANWHGCQMWRRE
jgi:hypothetical protein